LLDLCVLDPGVKLVGEFFGSEMLAVWKEGLVLQAWVSCVEKGQWRFAGSTFRERH